MVQGGCYFVKHQGEQVIFMASGRQKPSFIAKNALSLFHFWKYDPKDLESTFQFWKYDPKGLKSTFQFWKYDPKSLKSTFHFWKYDSKSLKSTFHFWKYDSKGLKSTFQFWKYDPKDLEPIFQFCGIAIPPKGFLWNFGRNQNQQNLKLLLKFSSLSWFGMLMNA